MSSVYQLPSPPTQQPVNQVPYNGMAKATSSQISTPKESMVNNLPVALNGKTSTVTTNGQPVQVNSKSAASGSTALKTVTKRKSGYLYNPLKIDTSVASKSTPVSPTSQSSSPQPTSASSTTHSPRPKSNNNNTFVHKLYQMLSDPKQSNYIRWNETGYSFIIRNVQGFSHNVLPLHFRHNNFSSFVRQLNMYGFHKVNKNTPSSKNSENQVWEFFHPKFIRGKPHLIEEIKRKQIESENWRSNALLQDPTRLAFNRHSSYYSNKNAGGVSSKRSSANLIVTTATVTVGSNSEPLITPPEVPGQQGPAQVTAAPTSIPLTQAQAQTQAQTQAQVPSQAVYIQGTESIPSNNVTSVNVAVTTSGEQVIIDPMVHTPNVPMVQSLPVGTSQNIPGNFGVIQVPSQPMPYNEVSAAPSAHGTPIPQAMTMGNIMQQNPQAMVDPTNVVVNGHPMIPEVQANAGAGNPQGPLENDLYYNIQLLQMQNQDMNQRINDLQMNFNNLINDCSRRMDMQQSMIQQLMNKQPNQSNMNNVTVCSVDQGQALSNSFDVNSNSMVPQGAIVNNGIVTQSPVQHHQMLHQSPIQATQVMVQQNGYTQQPQTSEVLVATSPEQKIMNQNQSMAANNVEPMDQYINPHQLTNGVAYSAQTIYY